MTLVIRRPLHRYISIPFCRKCFLRWNSTLRGREFKPKIGLEIHAQLGSATKLFSFAKAPETAALPVNSVVSSFDMALPGTLPRLNRKSVEQCILAGVLLNCEIAQICRFDRKHYFYPDLPLGYQITQKACPIAKNGFFDILCQSDPDSLDYYEKRVKIQQLQLEMDSGKTLREGEHDLIDLNRAGVSLVEIVTAADLTNELEATLFVEQLRHLLMQNGVCGGKVHEGHMRIDANISITMDGVPGKKTELKNIATIADLRHGIQNELKRQFELLESGEEVKEETRTIHEWETIAARSKGEEMDYRFGNEPNLPQLRISPHWVRNAEKSAHRDMSFRSYVTEYGFPPIFSMEIMNDSQLGTFINEYLSHNIRVPYSHFSLWLPELEFVCDRISLRYPPTEPNLIRNFAGLISLNAQKRVTKLVCIDLLKELADQPCQDLTNLIDQRQLWQITDPDQISALVRETFEENPKLVERAKEQEPGGKSFKKLKRAAIIRARKRIDPDEVSRAIMGQLLEEAGAKNGGRKGESKKTMGKVRGM